MATLHPKYVSIFKIDGVPILPPLMTAEKRRQMHKYKETAIQLQQSRKNAQQKPFPLELTSNLLRHGHSHIPQPATPRKHLVEASTSTAAASKRDGINKLRKTETIVYDNRANSIILTLEGFEEETEFQSVEIERPHNLDQNDNKISPDVPKSPVKDDSANTSLKPQPYAAFIPIPSICVNPPTPCFPINPFCEPILPKRLCGSPTLKPESESGLVRSHSFTLDGPSSALLEHIKNQKIKKSTATQDTVESKAKRVQKVETKQKVKSPFSTSLGHFPSNTVIFKTKRSPYEMKPSAKAKLSRKHKFVKPVTPKKSLPSSPTPTINGDMDPTASKQDVLKNIEERHRTRFLELVRQQQDEQKRLQEQFETQQKLLLEQLSASMAKVQMSSPTSTSTIDSAVISAEQEPSSARVTPRRRLFPEKLTASNGCRDPSPSPQSQTPTTAARRWKEHQRRQYAATQINACVRGFLTRRLFRTDYVQRIVQTIKDTLIFVLNLHMESSRDNSEDSIKLKARLLQQLISASRTLHSVFIDTTVKERMEIIARDRKYIQAKLMNLNMKRSPRIIG